MQQESPFSKMGDSLTNSNIKQLNNGIKVHVDNGDPFYNGFQNQKQKYQSSRSLVEIQRKNGKLHEFMTKNYSILQSLPRTTILFLVVSCIDILAVIAFIVFQIVKKATAAQQGLQNQTDSEKLHIIVIEIISIIFYIYYVWDAIYRENSVELLSAMLQVLVLCGRTYWFAYTQTDAKNSWYYFLLITLALLVTLALAYITYMHFGWRIYSKVQCDPRSKEGTERMKILFMQNRFTTLLKLDFQFCLLYFAVELIMTMENSVVGLRLWLNKAILSQSILVIALLSPWALLASIAVRQASVRLLRALAIITPIVSLIVPALSTVYVVLPGNFNDRNSNVTYIICLAVYLVCRFLAYWYMFRNFKVLEEFQKVNGPVFKKGRYLKFGNIDDKDIPKELLPLVRGAWLIKKSKGNSRKRRFFQMSADGTTLRWAWNKYIYLFYITSVHGNDQNKEITLNLGDYEPDLQVKFTDRRQYETWLGGLKFQHESLLDPRGGGFALNLTKDHSLQRKHSNILGNLKPNVSRRPQCRTDPNAQNLNQILQYMKVAQDLAYQMSRDDSIAANGVRNSQDLGDIASKLPQLQQAQNPNYKPLSTQNGWYNQFQQSLATDKDAQNLDVQNTLKRLIDTQQTYLNPGQSPQSLQPQMSRKGSRLTTKSFSKRQNSIQNSFNKTPLSMQQNGQAVDDSSQDDQNTLSMLGPITPVSENQDHSYNNGKSNGMDSFGTQPATKSSQPGSTPVWNQFQGSAGNKLMKTASTNNQDVQELSGQERFMVEFTELNFGKFLGRGGQGAVYAALYNDTPVAVKKTSHQEVFMHILSGSHDNIVAFRGWAADENQDTYLIMEYCPRGTLDVMLHHTAQNLEISKILPIVRSIARGMLHLHKRKILHRDIKPGNIFVSPGQVMKIGDFGQSRQLELVNPQDNDQQLSRVLSEGVIGTAQYAAPELYNENNTIDADNVQETLKADVYSFGVMLYEMLSKKRPFADYDSYQIAYKWLISPDEMILPPVTISERESPKDKRIFTALHKIMKQCCEHEVAKRPTFEQVTKDLKMVMDEHRPGQKGAQKDNQAPNSVQAQDV